MMGPVRRRDVAQNLRRSSHLVQLRGGRLLDRGIGLQHDADRALAANRFPRGRDGRLPGDRERRHDAGKQHRLTDRQNDHAVRRERRMTLTPPFASCSACSAMMSRLLCRAEKKATIRQRRSLELPTCHRKPDATLETPMRDLQAPDRHAIAAPGNRRTPATSNISAPAEISTSCDSTPGRTTRINKSRSLSRYRPEAPRSPAAGRSSSAGRTGGAFVPPARSSCRLQPTSNVSDRRSSNKPLNMVTAGLPGSQLKYVEASESFGAADRPARHSAASA
jgi:hypothetical protein